MLDSANTNIYIWYMYPPTLPIYANLTLKSAYARSIDINLVLPDPNLAFALNSTQPRF